MDNSLDKVQYKVSHIKSVDTTHSQLKKIKEITAKFKKKSIGKTAGQEKRWTKTNILTEQ
ncbi:hypothetical protein HUJ04_001533 [Dendroctonus ponderosae]|nr:hypothetical protein HUJ04_001533 [Dendroctonus ponderosae]